jgi:AraC-like DNA-binding protein
MSIIDLSLSANDDRADRLFSKQVREARRFFQGPPSKGSENIVVIGGFERVESDYSIRHRRFPFMGIEFVVGGRGTAHLAGGRFDLGAGTIFSYASHTPHDIKTDPKRPLAKFFVSTDGRAALRLMKRVGFVPDAAWQSSIPGDLQRLFDELLIQGARSGPISRTICDHLLELILLVAANSKFQAKAQGEAFETYERCCRIIDTGAMQLRTLDDAARCCGLSSAYLCRLFKRYERQSPYHRLLRTRMNIAAARFRDGNVLVKDVAKELGYADVYHFSHVFKRVFGCSPVTMRGVATKCADHRPDVLSRL